MFAHQTTICRSYCVNLSTHTHSPQMLTSKAHQTDRWMTRCSSAESMFLKIPILPVTNAIKYSCQRNHGEKKKKNCSVSQELQEQFIPKFKKICLHAPPCWCCWLCVFVYGNWMVLWHSYEAADLWECKATTKFILKKRGIIKKPFYLYRWVEFVEGGLFT